MYNGFVIKEFMLNGKTYDGNTLKYGITVDNENYIVKRYKDNISSIYSEHIASRFIRGLGINCHETWLGYDSSGVVVIMKDFCTHGAKLRTYRSTSQSDEYNDVTIRNYTYTRVIESIALNKKLSSIAKRKAIMQFWDMFICDAILGNRDRHQGNWGYLIKGGKYIVAPIYDNGGSLFPDLSTKINEYIASVNSGKEYKFIEERSEKFPASLFQKEGKDGKIRRTNYNEILHDLRINETLATEVKAIREKVGFTGIYERAIASLSDASNIIPPEYRRFYLIIICTRYLHMIERKSIKESYMITIRRLNNETRQW